ALVDQPRRLPGQQARRLDLCRHVGDEEVDALVDRDRLAELDAGLRVLDGVLEGRTRDPHRAGRGPRPGEVERLPRDLESLALLPEAVRGRHPDVLEGERRRIRRPLTELVEVLLDDDAVRVGRYDEGRQATVPGRAVRRDEDDEPGRFPRVRDEHLRAVEDVVAAVPGGGGLDRRYVRAGAGL